MYISSKRTAPAAPSTLHALIDARARRRFGTCGCARRRHAYGSAPVDASFACTASTMATASIRLNAPAPNFECTTTHGPLEFYKYKEGKWAILFSHPADFTPVCTTEFIEFAKRSDWFAKRNVVLLGCSVDSVYSHIAWVRTIEEKFHVRIPFPVIADLDQKVVRLYGMIPDVSLNTSAARCVFIIDPNNIVRAMIYYPLNLGRSFDEIQRVVVGLQTVDAVGGIACPADWTPGTDVIVGAPTTMAAADARVQDKSLKVTDWWFSKKELPVKEA